MNLSQAYANLQRVLDPLPLDPFLDEVLGQRALRVPGSPEHFRAGLLGDRPEQIVLDAYARLAPAITSHAEGAIAPPPDKQAIGDAEAFHRWIGAYHDRGYTVRLPDLRGRAPGLDLFLRSLECAFHKKVDDCAFWSRAGGKAPVHFDEYDIIVVQLLGRKRWHISLEQSELQNQWKTIPDGPPDLGRHQTVEVGPGDLLYLPRGTFHAVEALTDSLHLSIGFVPLTVREAIIAAVDHLSDLDRGFRETIGGRLGVSVRTSRFGETPRLAADGVQKLMRAVSSPGFMEQALQSRSSREVSKFDKLEPMREVPALTPDTRLRHSSLAMCHLSGNAEMIDFSYPGNHIYVHRGVERGVAFIAETPEFTLRDIPGEMADDVRHALVTKFLTSGFLEIAG